MRLLANENFAGDAVEALRERGHDVIWIRAEAPGSRDADVLAWARNESRVLVTFDKDFGELAFHSGLPASSGTILSQIAPRSAEFIARVAADAIGPRDDWIGHFAVIEETCVRMRPLPDA